MEIHGRRGGDTDTAIVTIALLMTLIAITPRCLSPHKAVHKIHKRHKRHNSHSKP
jgi:hypothetical protein